MTVLLICGLAVARLTRLWRDDALAEGPRDWVLDHLDTLSADASRRAKVKRWLFALLDCPWCFSGWMSLAAVVLVDSATSRSVDLPVLAWLVTWYIANLGYWLLELVADRDALLWDERRSRGLE